MSKQNRKTYREWILTPVLVLIDKPGFIHHEIAVQACISIESTNDVQAYIVSIKNEFYVALNNPTDFDCECAKNTIDHLLKVDKGV